MLNQFKTGIFYTAMGKYSIVIVNLIVQAVLARILVPEAFGIVSAINIFLLFFQMATDFGIGPAVIQFKDLEEEEINSIFTFSLYVSLAFAVIFFFLGYPISLFYGNPVFVAVSRVMAVTVFFYGIDVVPQALLQREQKFKKINVTTIIGALASGVVSIILALFDFSYYSIIIGNTMKALVLFIVYYSMTKPNFRFKIDLNPLKKIYRFSRDQFAFNVVNFFSRNLDKLLIGRFFSSSALAYYDQAYKASLYPNQALTSLVTNVVHPIMSDFQDESEKIKRVYLTIANLLATLGLPLSVFLIFAGEDVIFFLFGSQWGNSVLTFQILAFTVWIQMILSSTGGIFQSGNRTDLLLTSGVLSTGLNVTGIIIGILFGRIETVAAGLVVTFSLNLLQANYLILVKQFNSSIMEFFKILRKPFLLALMQIIALSLLPELAFSSFINLVIQGTVFLVVWILGLIVTGDFARIKRSILGR